MTSVTTTTDAGASASMKVHNLGEHQDISTVESIRGHISPSAHAIGNSLPRTIRARLGKVKCGDRKSRAAQEILNKEVHELTGTGPDEQMLPATQFEEAKKAQEGRKGVRGPRERISRKWNKNRNANTESKTQLQQAQPRSLCH